MEKPIAIGIDLGTTNSCVGVFQFGAVEIIANNQGSKIIPSYVAFTDTEQLVGEAAKIQVAQNPENTVYDAKRLIGRRFDDESIRNDMKHFSFKLVNKGGKPNISVKYREENKIFNPEQISSLILCEMKAIAESYVGTPITDAVITVPAYFNDAQRQATKDAGKIAGLNVLRIINEPTAAALAFGVDKKTKSMRTVLVFDLGGGTFDVSILTIDGGFFEVKSTSGDTHLGGEDFDSRIVNYFADEFRKKHGKNISNDLKALRKLRAKCEFAKRTLSSHSEANIEIESLLEGIDFESSITRIIFEKICDDLFKKTLEPVEKALADANLDKSKIDDIILVGGSTRIPKIQRMLKEFFNGKELNNSIHPEEAVAYGAAIQAAIINEHYEAQDLLLLDVTPLSLGIETIGGKMEVLISRNTTIPVNETKLFSTAHDNQNSVLVKVYEGERSQTRDNKLLGRFQITNIPKAPSGVPHIEVTFEIDTNGILITSAVEKSSGIANHIKIENKDRFSKQEISLMIREAEENHAADEQYRQRIVALSGLKNHLIYLKSVIHLESFNSIMSVDDRQHVENKIKAIDEWIDDTPNAARDDYRHMRKELEAVCNPVLDKFKQLNSGAAASSGNIPSTSDRPRTVPLIEEIE